MRAILELVRSPCCCCLRDDAMVVSVGVVEFGVLDVAVFGECVYGGIWCGCCCGEEK